ncbi:hypothetical protein F4813DRAFT_367477 [Daldinia decipiens]|uniref:uncharacterized protein n=1 Tax=Daldinia decipiens TaxID=326647 RepID=UPI0020C3E5F5|nr:uncharacterized protein F4813DRAFT_367477 [Daldinia decipiens]KAI1655306.1 hypothetical protein F4813DRAFT_367477 [Daldinia decipiens]
MSTQPTETMGSSVATTIPTACESKGDGGAEAPSYTLVYTILCLLPVLFVVVATYFRDRETTAHAFLLKGLRMFAIRFGCIVIGIFSMPILCLHYVDKY